MHALFGIGTPSGLLQFQEGMAADFGFLQDDYLRVWIAVRTSYARLQREMRHDGSPPPRRGCRGRAIETAASSTGS